MYVLCYLILFVLCLLLYHVISISYRTAYSNCAALHCTYLPYHAMVQYALFSRDEIISKDTHFFMSRNLKYLITQSTPNGERLLIRFCRTKVVYRYIVYTKVNISNLKGSYLAKLKSSAPQLITNFTKTIFHHDAPSLGGRSSKSTIVDNKPLRVYHNDVSLYNIRQRHTLQLLSLLHNLYIHQRVQQ